MGRAVGGAGEVEMGNSSTGAESAVSIALASPLSERNRPTSSLIPQRLKLVRLNGGTRIYHLNARTKKTVKSSTGTPYAVKVARTVWMRGKSESSYLCIRWAKRDPGYLLLGISPGSLLFVSGELLLLNVVLVFYLLDKKHSVLGSLSYYVLSIMGGFLCQMASYYGG